MRTSNIVKSIFVVALFMLSTIKLSARDYECFPGVMVEYNKMLFYIDDEDSGKCEMIDFFYLEKGNEATTYANTCWYNYTNDPEKLKWFDLIDYSGDVVIPSEIEYNGKSYTVTSVCCWTTGSFGTSQTTSITIPGSVYSLAGFSRVAHLEKLIVHEGVSYITGIEKMYVKEIELPSTINFIAPQSFRYLSGLEEFTVPADVTELMGNMLYDCPDLKVLKMNNVKKFSNRVGYNLPQLITLDLGVLEEIGQDSFSYLISLDELTIPETTKIIGPNCFCNIPYLKVLNLPSHPIELDRDFNTTGVKVINVKCPEPYDLNGSFSGGNPKSQIKIYVPGGSGEAYRAHPDWNNLGEIIEDYTGVENVSVEKFEARGGSGFIEVAVTPAAEVTVYATDGRIVITRMIDGTGKIEVPAGAYIVKCGQETAKVIVR